jgi:membrane-associated phospholipid phosphatase
MFKDFLASVPKNFIRSFSGKNLFWHLTAIALTVAIVMSGFDWYYFLSVRGESLNIIFFPGIIVGGLLPILLPLGLVIVGRRSRNGVTKVYGWALMQAALLGWMISSLYKSVTGRVQPDLSGVVAATDQSRNWHFGFWEHGIFWGWPSSHTTVAFAMVATFVVLLRGKRSVAKWLAIVYAFYIGIAVSFSIHWFSEFVAGAIIGTVIGVTVGKWWKDKCAAV